MTIRVPLPDGQWADLRGPAELTGADQDAYYDAYDEIMASKPQPEPQPDPANPAVMLEPARPRFSNADGRVLRDRLLGMVITAWSYDHLPIPYTAEYKKQLPVLACNALYRAVKPMDDALSGTEDDEAEGGPKAGESPGSGGSSDTSPESTASLLPARHAAPSATP
jgi:hypothetical protein